MKKYFITFPKFLSKLFFIALSIILLQDFVLFDIDPFFPKAYEMAILLHNIFLALIASIIFYFIIQHVPYINKCIKVSTFMKNTAYEIQIICRDIVRTIYVNNNDQYIDCEAYHTYDEIFSRIDEVKLRSKVCFCYDDTKYEDWLYLLLAFKETVLELHSTLAPYNELIPKEALEKLLMIIQILIIRINPEIKIKTKTMLSPKIFSKFISEIVKLGYDFNRLLSMP